MKFTRPLKRRSSLITSTLFIVFTVGNACASPSSPATMSSPAPGSTLTSATATFTWTAGSGISDYQLAIGSTSGGTDLFSADENKNLSQTVTLPTDGRTLYVKLTSKANRTYIKQYTYTAYKASSPTASTPAVMSSPVPGSVLPSSSVTFTWTAGAGNSQYGLSVGTTPGSNIGYVQTTATSATVSGIPTDGSAIYVELESFNGSTWTYAPTYTYTAASSSPSGSPAVMSSPAPGSTLPSSTATFTWSTGSGVSQYSLAIGTTAGGSDILNANEGTSTTATVGNLPLNASTVYVKLGSLIGTGWQYSSYTYTAAATTTTSAGAVPTQFAKLLTNATDYTCAGLAPCSTWPYPAMPANGTSYNDPNWGTTTYRLTPPTNATSGVIPAYSRVQSWNSNNSRLIASENTTAYTDLYDATTTPPTPIARMVTTDGLMIDTGDQDALWANTDPNRIYYTVGSGSGHGLELRYVDVSTCTSAGCVLTPVVVHTFACTTDSISNPELGAGVAGNKIETGSGAQGGMFDATDRYFTFTCDKVDSSGRHEIDFIRYDRQLDQVSTQTKWYNLCPRKTPAGCKVFTDQNNTAVNMVRMSQHPNGQYITVLWQDGDYDETWTRGTGVEAFDANYNFVGVISGFITHEDMGYDVNGKPVWVGVGAQCLNCVTEPNGHQDDTRTMEIVDLTKISTTLPASGIPTGKVHALLPCSYSWSSGTCGSGVRLATKTQTPHISMTGSWGSTKGYGLLSTMALYGANSPYAQQDEPSPTVLTAAITGTGVQTFPVANTGTIGVGTGITIGVTGGASPDFCTVTAVSGNNVTCAVAHKHANGETVQSLTVGDTGMGAMELVALKIDSTQADWAPVAGYYRIGRTMSIRDGDYNAEPHATVNRDFTQILWGSNWNVDGGTVYGFWTPLP